VTTELSQTEYETEIARTAAEKYRLRNVEFEQEITKRHQLEATLRSSETLYRNVVEGSRDGIAIIQNGFIRFANAQLQTMLSYTFKELSTIPVEELAIPEERTRLRTRHERRIKGELVPSRYEASLLTKEGHTIDVEVNASVVEYEGHSAVLAFIRDIGSQKQATAVLKQRNRQLTLLNRANQLFSSTLNLDQVLETVLTEIHSLLDVSAASFWLSIPETGELICRQATGPGVEQVVGWRLALGQGLTGWVAEHGEPLLVPDTRADDRHFKDVDQRINLEIRSILSIPLKVHDTVIGVLNLVDTEVNRFTEEELTHLEPLVASAAFAIENARLHTMVQAELEERKRAEFSLMQLNEELEQRVAARTLALRESESRFRRVITSISDHIYATQIIPTGERLNLYISPNVTGLTGYPREKFVADWSFWPSMVIHPDDRELAAVHALHLPLDRQSEIEYRLVRADGQVIWVRDSARIEEVEGSTVIYGVVSDISERKYAEEELKRSHNELLTLNAITTTISLTRDLDQVLSTTLGLLLAVVDPAVGCIQLIDAETGKLVIAAQSGFAQNTIDLLKANSLAEAVKRTGLHDLFSEPLAFKNRVLGQLSIFCHKNRQLDLQEVQLMNAVCRQISVAIENDRLAKEAAETRVKQELDHLRSELVSNVSHELRTPLGLIKAASTTLLASDVEFDYETRQTLLHGINEETDRLEHIVNNLLDISRLEQQRLRLSTTTIDLKQFVRRLVEAIQIQIELNQHHFVLDFPTEPLIANIDIKRMEQVLRNLLVNAIKYSPARSTITVRGRQENHHLLLQVRDEGIGIAVVDQSKIFERFYRVENEITRDVSGAGLGLTISRGIVEAHGGRIWVESAPDQGSTFYITLPPGAK